jgi:S-DNA-T family DNA segregation ATPase FtsK/SpoIIIE
VTIATTVTDPAQTIERTLEAHGVSARHATTFAGPTILQYAFTLTAGTPLRKVTALAKDIALAIGLDDVRIVAPIPGTSYVGIEVPRQVRETVTYADFVTDTDAYEPREAGEALPIPIGVDVGNTPIWADLTKLPHLLIAGATNSGKSVALTSLVTSLIDHKTPDECRLWLIDPKRVELAAFADAPHVEAIATTPEDALDVLINVVDIMDYRYSEFAIAGVRNVAEFNDAVASGTITMFHMPYQVVVIDEIADLMMTSGKATEARIVRLAQLGRAAGIHLVLATQRPTKDVVTGLIGANVPSRWAFSVRSVTDSMVALDQTGAQALYGQGDSLWLPAGADKPIRVQAVYTDDDTIAGVVNTASFNARNLNVETSASPQAADDNDDDLTLADIGVEDLGGLERVADEIAGQQRTMRQARVRDRSENWLDAVPVETDVEWKTEVVGGDERDATILELLHEVRDLRRQAQVTTVPPKRRFPSRWMKIAAGVVGTILVIGWMANVVEAIAR